MGGVLFESQRATIGGPRQDRWQDVSRTVWRGSYALVRSGPIAPDQSKRGRSGAGCTKASVLTKLQYPGKAIHIGRRHMVKAREAFALALSSAMEGQGKGAHGQDTDDQDSKAADG